MPESTTDNPKPRRRWLQFRLQTLLLVTAVLCVLLAWIGVRMNEKRKERAVIAELQRLGATVLYDWQRVPFVNPNVEPTSPKWLRWLLGDDFFGEVVYVCYNPLERTNFDDGIRLASTFSHLDALDLSGTEIGDFGLIHLQGMAHLQFFNLRGSNVTDADLRHLKSLTALKYLLLNETTTTSKAIDDLAKALPGCEIDWP